MKGSNVSEEDRKGRACPDFDWELDQICPFLDKGRRGCRASVSDNPVDGRRRRLCCSDEFDNCGTYLAYLLRRTRPKRSDCDWLDCAR